MKISAERLAVLQEQVRLKDQAAFALGVAVAELELEKARVRGSLEMSDHEKLYRIGAAHSEFDKYVGTHMRTVAGANSKQAEVGEAALRELGLPHERTFTIDPKSGEVLELLNGAYVPVEEKS